MRVGKEGGGASLELDRREVELLRWALERASFIDTPAGEQAAIQSFCNRVLEQLPKESPG